jgi:hypothetical protein
MEPSGYMTRHQTAFLPHVRRIWMGQTSGAASLLLRLAAGLVGCGRSGLVPKARMDSLQPVETEDPILRPLALTPGPQSPE